MRQVNISLPLFLAILVLIGGLVMGPLMTKRKCPTHEYQMDVEPNGYTLYRDGLRIGYIPINDSIPTPLDSLILLDNL